MGKEYTLSMQLHQILSILSDRNAIIKKKETEAARAAINEMYE